MVPLVFILIVSLVLILLVYWVLSTMRLDDAEGSKTGSLFFETAPELYAYGYMPDIIPHIPFEPNRLHLCRGNSTHLLSYWMVEDDKKEEFSKAGSDGELVLRIYQTSAGVVYDEIPVDSLKGSHYFELKPETAYYTVLGLKNKDAFSPWLYSNTMLTSLPIKTRKTN